MSTELTTLPSEELKAMVASLPPEKRAAFSKAARAACRHLADSRKNYDKAFEVAGLMVENWWRLGLELPRLIKPGRPQKQENPDICQHFTLQQLGITEQQSVRCQKLAEKSKAELDEHIEKFRNPEKYTLPTLSGQIPGIVHTGDNSGEQEWYTPSDIIEAARKVLGEIDLDPASSAIAQKTVKAKRYFTAKQNGLEKDWAGRVWLNPPYAASKVDEFIAKLVKHFESNDIRTRVTDAIALTNNATETTWFQSASQKSSGLCLPAGRIRFLDEKGNPGHPLQGQALLYFGQSQSKFEEVFSQFGKCWRPAA